MANKQHIEWLKEGREAWNARRERDDFVPDFSGLDPYNHAPDEYIDNDFDFSGFDLRKADFSNSLLIGANFKAASLGSGPINRLATTLAA